MNVFEDVLKEISNQIGNLLEEATSIHNITNYFEKIDAQISNFEKTGSFVINEGNNGNIKKERITEGMPDKESFKENVESQRKSTNKPTRRTTRMMANENAKNTINLTNSHQLKLERISEVSIPSNEIVDMPPPQEPVRKGKIKRTTNIRKVKVEHVSPKEERESDIYIQPERISIINLADSDDDIKEKPSRSSRTKTRAQASKEKEISAKSSFVKEAAIKTIKGMLDNDIANLDNNEVDTKEVSVRSTRTKTRALAAKESQVVQDNEKQLQENDIVKSSENDNKIQEKVQKPKETFASKEKIQIKTKEKDEKETAKRSPSISPVFNGCKSKKYKELNKIISDKTFTKSPQKEIKELNQTTIINKPADPIVCSDKALIANETIVIPKDKRMIVTTPLNKLVNLSDLLTDDDDDKICNQTPVKKPGKPIFSAFENSPVKKRVEAFEKLGAQLTPTIACDRVDKYKSKLPKKQEEKNKDSTVKSAVKSKQKVFTSTTPLKSTTRLIPPRSQTSTKPTKPGLKDLIQPKSASALKAYQQEFFERELRRQEKEREVARKREAMLQAKKDENKRKREEKQLKAQQVRDALLKSKQQMVDETEKLEIKKWDQGPSQKFIKIVEKQETNEVVSNNLTKQMKATPLKKNLQKPIFLNVSAPLLPVDDCYDSDDERRQHQTVRPKWTKKNKMYQVSQAITFAGYECSNTMFMCQATTPDLQALFGKLNPKKLKRTSSAVWNKPPRFTIMPITNEEDEENL